jgi:hypothetical protein
VAERDCAAVHVQFFRRDRQVAQHGERLRRKRFVEFDEIEVVEAHARTLEQLPDGRNRSDPHDPRVDARARPSDDPCERLDASSRGAFGVHENEGRAAVGDTG